MELTDLKRGEIVEKASQTREKQKKFYSVSEKVRKKRNENWRDFLNHSWSKTAQEPATGGGWEE